MTSADWGAVEDLEPAAGRLLVATPLLGDAHFNRTVVYLLEHDGGGTVGVVMNRPSHTPVAQVLPDWHDAVSGPAVVFGGGPVQPDGALCLGQLQPGSEGIREVVDGVSTVDLDGDVAVIAPNARRLRVFAGHAGWAPGQLDDERDEGAWWVLAGSPDDLFSEDPKSMWRQVLRRQPPPLSLLATYPPDVLLN
ncbi:MAG: putative transcriptional regulator [Pseudonocardiales bacterium]|jgi:putative transcriptional regulator|nr:putative transcriptional regulator [Pseudonocardiales bacterium]